MIYVCKSIKFKRMWMVNVIYSRALTVKLGEKNEWIQLFSFLSFFLHPNNVSRISPNTQKTKQFWKWITQKQNKIECFQTMLIIGNIVIALIDWLNLVWCVPFCCCCFVSLIIKISMDNSRCCCCRWWG